MRHTASRPAPPPPSRIAHAPAALVLIEQALLGLVALAAVALVSLPAARAANATFGCLPFWLLALPLSAWACARALRLRATPMLPRANVHVLAMRPRTPTRTARPLPRAA